MKKFLLPAILSALLFSSCSKDNTTTSNKNFSIREDATGWWHATSGECYSYENGPRESYNVDSVWVYVTDIEDGKLIMDRWFNSGGMTSMGTGGLITSDTEIHLVEYFDPNDPDDPDDEYDDIYYLFDWKMSSATTATYESHTLSGGKEVYYEYYTLEKLSSVPDWYPNLYADDIVGYWKLSGYFFYTDDGSEEIEDASIESYDSAEYVVSMYSGGKYVEKAYTGGAWKTLEGSIPYSTYGETVSYGGTNARECELYVSKTHGFLDIQDRREYTLGGKTYTGNCYIFYEKLSESEFAALPAGF